MKKLLFLIFILFITFQPRAQNLDCTFKPPLVTIHFGSGNVRDPNSVGSYIYRRVSTSCPTDGHYSLTPYTSNCFSSDWFTIAEDHTPGDVNGNMMLVNASPYSGTFLTTTLPELKNGTTYEFGVWMMNVCKITDKCPFPLLPNISIQLQTPAGKIVAQVGVGELARGEAPIWKQYKAVFTLPPGEETGLTLIMMDNAPGGCGNDFALDDITIRECIITKPVVTTTPKTHAPIKQKAVTPKPVVAKPKTTIPEKQKPVVPKPVVKKSTPPPVRKELQISKVTKPQTDSQVNNIPVIKPKQLVFTPPPPVLITRANPLIKEIKTEAGEIKLSLYDNGEIDGDTITVYHNNQLLVAHAGLSEKAISFTITVDAAHPHHEFIMVADNLGSIPPNTSLMVITAGTQRYEVFISSTEQKNAKVVIDLKE